MEEVKVRWLMETYLSETIGKPVVLISGEIAGYVIGARLSKKLDAVRALVCADEDEEEFILPAASIRASGDGGVMIRGLGGKPPKETVPAPVGMRVLSEQGDLLGIVQDFVCEGKIVRSVLLSSGETCPPEKIHGVGECLILGDAPKKTAAKKLSAPLSETPEIVGKSEETCEKEVAASAQAGSNLLTGKRVPRDISDVRGNVIIRKGSVITPEVLKSAIFHNKLFELTVTVLNAD